ncbi:MAG: hypothetical protein RMI79_02950 [Nitrososphaerota archaeon]|nr:hypothetical protein [Nitrososphaerota archaeon]
MILGDGYYDDRHIDIYNSSLSVVNMSISVLNELGFSERIRINIYGEPGDNDLRQKWEKIFNKNIKIIKNTSPWKHNLEKIRIRIASKELASFVKETFANFSILARKEKLDVVRGLFDAEASVDLKGYIEFKQKNSEKGKRITEFAYTALMEEGIDATSPKLKHDKESEQVYFYVKDIKKFMKIVGFYNGEKSEKANRILKIKENDLRITEKEIIKHLNKWKTLEELMYETNAKYHRIRIMLIKLNHQGKVTTKKIGNKNYYLIAR